MTVMKEKLCASPNHSANPFLSERRLCRGMRLFSCKSASSGCSVFSSCMDVSCSQSEESLDCKIVTCTCQRPPPPTGWHTYHYQHCHSNIQGNEVGHFDSNSLFELCSWLPLPPHALLAVLGLAGCVGWLLLIGQQWMDESLFVFSPSGNCVAPVTEDGGGQILKEYT